MRTSTRLLALLAALAAATLSTPAQAAPAKAEHCVSNLATGANHCYATFQQAITAATGGTVTTAPKTPPLAGTAENQRLTEQLESAGQTRGAAAVVIGIQYEHGNFGGASWTTSVDSACTDKQSWVSDFWNTGWNDKISSFQTFNNCYVTFYEHGGYTGATQEWYANDAANLSWEMNDKPSSVKWTRGPSRAELLKECGNKTSSCEAHVDQRYQDFSGDWGRVDTAFNCSSSKITQVVGKRDIRNGKNSVSHEISVSAGFKFLVDWSVSYKATFGQEWGWQTEENVETRTEIAPGHWAGLDRSPTMRSAGGYYELWYDKPKWGHRQWFVLNFYGDGPAPGVVGQTRVVGAKMTAAEKKKVCGKSAGVVRGDEVPAELTRSSGPAAATRELDTPRGALHS